MHPFSFLLSVFSLSFHLLISLTVTISGYYIDTGFKYIPVCLSIMHATYGFKFMQVHVIRLVRLGGKVYLGSRTSLTHGLSASRPLEPAGRAISKIHSFDHCTPFSPFSGSRRPPRPSHARALGPQGPRNVQAVARGLEASRTPCDVLRPP